MLWPSNLAPRAVADLVDILRYTAANFGDAQADNVELAIVTHCKQIEDGYDLGHTRHDLQRRSRRPVKFVVVQLLPFVIAYNPKTKKVVRIVHGSRDFVRIFGPTDI